MKTLLQPLFFFLLATQICSAQWFWQNPLPQGNSLQSVFFMDPNTGWTVGDYGAILKTTDDGDNWISQTSGTTNLLESVYFKDLNSGWAVGNEGIILKTTNGGVSFINEDAILPKGFYLSQNYPNPFNPVTSIKYQIPELSLVTLKVFDVLGNEIETLVNEEKLKGTYQLTWNAANLPSGIYFYQIRATPGGGQAVEPSTGSGQVFVQTKKMILLK